MPQPKRSSTVQPPPPGPVPDLGALRKPAGQMTYTLVAYDDCDPPEYAIGLYRDGQPVGLLFTGGALGDGGRILTSRSPNVLRAEAERRGLTPHGAIVTGG